MSQIERNQQRAFAVFLMVQVATVNLIAQQPGRNTVPATRESTRNTTNQTEISVNQRGTAVAPETAADAIRPFKVNFPKAALDDLRRRIAATRWPEQELVTDQSQGVQLATMKKLVSYWQSDYDWRKIKTKLNSFPQFITTIDGVDIHFAAWEQPQLLSEVACRISITSLIVNRMNRCGIL